MPTRSNPGDTHGKLAMILVLIVALIGGGATILAAVISRPEKESEPPHAATISFPPDLPCEADTQPDDVIDSAVFVVDRNDLGDEDHNLHFLPINGSARHYERDGRSYYWGRVGRADRPPLASGGAYIRWRTASQAWHACRVILPKSESDWVRTPAVAATIAGERATIQVCLWRDLWKDEKGKVWDPDDNCFYSLK